MVRRCASWAFGLALIVALGFALAHACVLQGPGASTGFSTPCGPASPAITAGGESIAVLTVDVILPAGSAGAAVAIGCRASQESAASVILPAAPAAFPPLRHRPPPPHS